MGSASVTHAFPGTVAEAERCWYETARWPHWVDGLERVLAVDGPWPLAGSTVTWESGPAGRGRVVERVIAHEPLRGQTLEVEDPSMTGTQSVVFEPEDETVVRITFRLDYRLRRRSPLTPLLDRVFIQRPMAISLEATLGRFGAELRGVQADTSS